VYREEARREVQIISLLQLYSLPLAPPPLSLSLVQKLTESDLIINYPYMIKPMDLYKELRLRWEEDKCPLPSRI